MKDSARRKTVALRRASNREYLIAYSYTELSYDVRHAPNVAHLKNEDVMVDYSEVATLNVRVGIITTQIIARLFSTAGCLFRD